MKEKVLVIDDSPTVLEILKDALINADFEVITADHGKIALQKAENANPDMIILDIVLPDMDGWQICEKLKKNKKTEEIPVIMMTGAMTGTEHQLKSFDTGIDDFVIKPVNTDILIARIKAIMNRSHKRELETILKFGLAKILGAVVATLVMFGIFYGITFRFVIKTSQLGRYANSQIAEMSARLNMLFIVEGSILILIVGLIIFSFVRVMNKRFQRLEELISKNIQQE
jgi:CheY-like chemotaxis protein